MGLLPQTVKKALRRSFRRRRKENLITFSRACTSMKRRKAALLALSRAERGPRKKYFAGRTRPGPHSQKRCFASFLTQREEAHWASSLFLNDQISR